MGRDGYGRDGWGRGSYYNDRYRDRDYGYGPRRYERDDRRYDDRYGGYYQGDWRDQYGGGGGGGYRDRYRGGGGYRGRGSWRGGGFRGGRDQKRNLQDRDEIDPEELEYIRKRQELLKQRRDEEENYVPEDVDTDALAAMGLPTGFGPPPKTEDENGEQRDDKSGRDQDSEQKVSDEKGNDGDRHHREGRRRSREKSEEKDEKRIKLDHEEAAYGKECSNDLTKEDAQKPEASVEDSSNLKSEDVGQTSLNESEQTAGDDAENKVGGDDQQGSLVTYSGEDSNSE